MKVKDAVKMGITSFYYKSLGSKIKDISDLMEVECHTEVWENGGGCERTIQDQIAVLEIDKMTLEQAIKEVSVAVGMHDTDKANLGWKVIKSNLEILEILRKNITLRDLYDIARISKMMRFEITDNDKEVFERVKEWLEQWKD